MTNQKINLDATAKRWGFEDGQEYGTKLNPFLPVTQEVFFNLYEQGFTEGKASVQNLDTKKNKTLC